MVSREKKLSQGRRSAKTKSKGGAVCSRGGTGASACRGGGNNSDRDWRDYLQDCRCSREGIVPPPVEEDKGDE